MRFSTQIATRVDSRGAGEGRQRLFRFDRAVPLRGKRWPISTSSTIAAAAGLACPSYAADGSACQTGGFDP